MTRKMALNWFAVPMVLRMPVHPSWYLPLEKGIKMELICIIVPNLDVVINNALTSKILRKVQCPPLSAGGLFVSY
jgi:hypothetical protein